MSSRDTREWMISIEQWKMSNETGNKQLTMSSNDWTVNSKCYAMSSEKSKINSECWAKPETSDEQGGISSK